MQTLAWLMAPAALISATAAIAIIAWMIRSRTIASKAMVIGVMVAVTVGFMLWDVVP